MAAIDAETVYRYALRQLETPYSNTRYQLLETSGPRMEEDGHP